ncbi:hypothetical protein [Streptomyces sp. RKAG337]|uniref:hypothetical protein n=1 Tax=Streptomyces sp. RKAG337 TaxID=2893404 RepID=UPI0020342A67|nr:hypothetical protein [Streptomyces sp. RKAG337]MCM2428851.1 hypothetical protein [Streptomyces sp. RKAG337]
MRPHLSPEPWTCPCPTHLGDKQLTPTEAISQIRICAADRAYSHLQIGAPDYIQAALDALLTGVDSPSLCLLAGLGRNEHSEAADLFDSMLEELRLLPLTAERLTEARWDMARWWAGQIIEGKLDPVLGARLIFEDAGCELGQPTELAPFGRVVLALLDDADGRNVASQEELDEITEAARRLLA